MKKAKIVITISENPNGLVEMKCQCQMGSSELINRVAHKIATELGPSVQSIVQQMTFKKKDNHHANNIH